jgi:predicted amidohydrolase YtcJ
LGITTDPDTGQVSNATAALNAIRALNDFDNKLRGTADAIKFAAANGLTSIHDPSNLDIQPDDYRVMNTLYRNSGRRLDVRMRHYRYFSTTNADFLRTYMDPIYNGVGDETYRIIGVGEQVGSDNDDLLENMRIVARAGWKLQQHTSTPARQVPFFKQVGTEFDLFPLRWNYCHPGVLTPQQIDDLKSVGVGTPISTGPFRLLIDGGLQCGAMTDATNVAPLSPWVKFYYMITGKTQAGYISGAVSNVGQQITRLEALRLYTIGSAWFSDEDDELGSFEIGKLADLAVLTHHYLDVSEEQIPKIKSDLTLQGGRVVHASGPFAGLVET